MEWHTLETTEDIKYLLDTYGNFLDSTLVSYYFQSGNYVDSDRVGYEFNDNNLYLLFQRLDDNPFSIEILFEYTKFFNFFAPVANEDNWNSEIQFAKIVKSGKWYYWTTWDEFNPDNPEHFNYNDFILIQAQSVKWRVVE